MVRSIERCRRRSNAPNSQETRRTNAARRWVNKNLPIELTEWHFQFSGKICSANKCRRYHCSSNPLLISLRPISAIRHTKSLADSPENGGLLFKSQARQSSAIDSIGFALLGQSASCGRLCPVIGTSLMPLDFPALGAFLWITSSSSEKANLRIPLVISSKL